MFKETQRIVAKHNARPTGAQVSTIVMTFPSTGSKPEVIHFDDLPAVECPCGTARRALLERADLPFTFHRTEITENARTHYHRALTETYYILECGAEAAMELDDVRFKVQTGDCIVIPPGTRHRAVGKMTVLILVYPKFDAADEWFD
jgi:mannose-6-phosphate isomerase-like protein (cupin superfamily)